MNDSIAIRRARWHVLPLVSAFMVLSLFSVVRAQQNDDGRGRRDSTIRRVLFTGHLNFDCFQDTVIGWADDEHRMLPRSIHWGTASVNRRENAREEDSACASATPKRSRVRATDIHYPNWKRFTASVSFMRMNNDTLADMVIILHGTPGDSWRGHRNADGVERGDSVRMLLVPGQQGLDSIATLNLAAIGGFQSEPYFALELVEGNDVVDPAVRDLSGAHSYEVKPVDIDVRGQERDTTHGHGPRSVTAGVDAAAHVSVRLYPNPAHTITSIAAAPVAPGAYTIEIIAANGLTVTRRDIDVPASRDLLGTLDVSELASGYYVVRLAARGRVVGAYPIIVTR